MTEPLWWSNSRAQKRRQNARSRSQERRVAKTVGGRVTAGSGSSWRMPEDVATDTQLIQHKGTEAASYRITLATWLALEANADRAGKEPLLLIEFATGEVLAVTRWK